MSERVVETVVESSCKNERDIFVFEQKLKEIIKPKKYFHFKVGSKRGNTLLTQLRLGRFFFNSHSFHLGMEELPVFDIFMLKSTIPTSCCRALSSRNRGMFYLELFQNFFQIL